jgi:hypothetical protein
MLERLRISGWKPLVAALYAVAMLMLGFAHTRASMPEGAALETASLQMAAYALPDGALPPICGQSKPGVPADHHGNLVCDACQLTSAPGAIPISPAFLEAPRLVMKLPPVRVLASVAAAPALEPQSRGPPQLS